MFINQNQYSESSHCGVGLLVSLKDQKTNKTLKQGLLGLRNLEHRGGADSFGNGDGAGIMTAIPREFFGIDKDYAIACIFAPRKESELKLSLSVFEKTFEHYGLNIESYRDVPINPDALGPQAKKNIPTILHAFIKRPIHCRTNASFDEILYQAKQMVRTKQKQAGITNKFFFTSLSSQTIVYKALATSAQLEDFYPDLKSSKFKTNFALFHRRFSTNTLPSWDKVQPFRLIAHNGEINTIEGNRAAAISREMAIGLRKDQLITHLGSSDSGNLNGMVEALKYRSSIPHINEVLAIMIPPAQSKNDSSYFHFWSRAMEPWDGPALVAYCDGKRIGARLDRSGFRPCRWHKTKDMFYLCSEAGAFEIPPEQISAQGELYAGRSVNIHTHKGTIDFNNPNKSQEYQEAIFDPRLKKVEFSGPKNTNTSLLEHKNLFYYTKEDLNKELFPMIKNGTEPIGSMGDTARVSALSDIEKSIYYYFYQNFAQVTNPPLDYIRESMVTDMEVILGRKPNIFGPKELIPPPKAFSLSGPVISLGQLESIIDLAAADDNPSLRTHTIDICFDRNLSVKSFQEEITNKANEAVKAVQNGRSLLILSDRKSSFSRPPIPAILVMRAVQLALSNKGIRLKASLIVDTGEVHNAHQAAVLIGFGASAVCPYLALNIARYESIPGIEDLDKDQREKNLIKALEGGIMRIMAKRGISVIRSYQGAELFTIIGLQKDITENLFSKHPVILGRIGFKEIHASILNKTEQTKNGEIPHTFIYKEHAGGKKGEKHAPTAKHARTIHEILQNDDKDQALKDWLKFSSDLHQGPLQIRDLYSLKAEKKLPIENVESIANILPRFGSGAMSFGSISAETQRDLILAFRKVKGRSNSGEGGENPYYYTDFITASIKQIASGRFGVTAEYLTLGHEVQIKMAQGAKPGEGGQLLGPKVNKDIAFARHSTPGVGLISPPPQHDIYSIEDLKQLIYEIKQLSPTLKVSVKLVSGHNIGAIALGVVKAGADAILISGGSGGTGAASLMSMKYTGLPWEIGLMEVHKLLSETGLRDRVKLRVDGGIITGSDIIKAALLGAEEFDFGKMILISQGCIMARICEKNTCPAGIATQDPKFKKRYKGEVQSIIRLLELIAEEARSLLSEIGYSKIQDIIGRSDLLGPNKRHSSLIKKLDLSYFKMENLALKSHSKETQNQKEQHNKLNKKILDDYKSQKLRSNYPIKSLDRAIPAGLNGHLAKNKISARQNSQPYLPPNIKLKFTGSAGQGFGVFLEEGVHIELIGEANDSVAKAMSGGSLAIRANPKSQFQDSEYVLAGNVCLYGATGGELFIAGMAGDRFAIRNSGALAVVEGAGLHACEYMTGGTVILLGKALNNIGAGMTGGTLYTHKQNSEAINSEYLKESPIQLADQEFLLKSLQKHQELTNSSRAKKYLDDFDNFIEDMHKFSPV